MTRAVPDRGHVRTEQEHPDSADLDQLDPEAIVRLMARDHHAVIRSVEQAAASIGAFVSELLPRLRGGGRLVYGGAGTSGRLGVLDASECPPTFQSDPGMVVGLIAGGDAALRRSSERREDEFDGAAADFEAIDLRAGDTFLGIAAGGTTPWVLGGMRLAKQRGASTAMLVCAPREVPEHCDRLITLDTGPEILIGSTRLKAGSATKLALNAITTATFVRLGKTHGAFMVDLAATNDKLVDRAARILRRFCPELARNQALAALEAAGMRLKTAIAMCRCGLPRDEAERRLAQANGSLRAIIG
jgi:N-acetylmuramic acid 6-phosphate etherase